MCVRAGAAVLVALAAFGMVDAGPSARAEGKQAPAPQVRWKVRLSMTDKSGEHFIRALDADAGNPLHFQIGAGSTWECELGKPTGHARLLYCSGDGWKTSVATQAEAPREAGEAVRTTPMVLLEGPIKASEREFHVSVVATSAGR